MNPQLAPLHLTNTLQSHSGVVDGGESGIREQL